MASTYTTVVGCMYQGRCISSGEIRAEGIHVSFHSTFQVLVLVINYSAVYCGTHYQWYLFVMATDTYSAHLWLFSPATE